MTQSNTGIRSFQGFTPAHRSKVIVALLASLLGVFGAHWWYLRRRYAWLFTLCTVALLCWAQLFASWWDNPAFFALLVPATAGFIEALVFCLKTDEWFDATYNQGSGQQTKTRWAPVIIAILTTLLGSTVLVFGIAVIVVYVYTALGWLDGYVL